MKFPIPFRSWTGRAALEIEIADDTPIRFRLKVACEIAVKNGADLTGANLTGADLTGADLTRANLTRADLTDADLTGANLTGANLTHADLTGADLTGADLTRANLTDADLTRANLTDADLTRANLTRADLTRADLTRANLTHADLTDANLELIKADLIAEILKLPDELEALRAAIIEGRIDGSTYNGDCACLAGTLSKARGGIQYSGCDIEVSADITFHAAASSARERFFTAIRPGDTPETNAASAIVLEWVDEAIAIRDMIRETGSMRKGV